MDQLERRQLLLTAIGTSLVAAAADANAQSKLSAVDVAPRKIAIPTLKLSAPVSVAKEIESWGVLKGRVSEANQWLKPFDTSYEAGVLDELGRIELEERGKYTHNPRLVEPLLGEIAALLDRCLAYRREGSELELAGVAAGAARVTADALRDIDRQIAEIDVSREAADVLAANYPGAAEIFEQASDANLGRGNSKQLAAQTLANQKISASSVKRSELALGRLAFVQDIERQLLGRHDVEGNAHNFGERFERFRKLYVSDILSAYRRALAASTGLDALFGYQTPVPRPARSGFLDQMVIWTRDAMRAVVLIAETEIDFVRSVMVPVPPQASNALVPVNADSVFVGIKRPRLRSIAISFCLEGGDLKNDNMGNATFGAVVVKQDTKLGPKTFIPVHCVRQYSSQRDPLGVDGALLHNVDPTGSWAVRLSAKGVAGNGAAGFDRAGAIKFLNIQFRVVGVPDLTVDGTWWMSEDRV